MSVRIGLGIATQPFSDPKTFFKWVDLCEDSRVDSLWQTDRLASREPYLEALSAMAALAGATERIKFGMNAVVVTARDPLVLAKQCATVDYLSGGRLLPVFGVGAGNAPEWEATGRSPKARGRRADEALEIMRRLWSEESVDFEGEHYRYQGASIAPRPVQQPLPLWIGGSSAAAIRRTARFGTGWLAGLQDPETIGEVVAAIKRATAEQGRHIDDDHFGASFPFRIGAEDDPMVERFRGRATDGGVQSSFAVGDSAAVIERCRLYREAGVSKFVMIPLARGDADLFDQTQRLVEEVLPVVHAWD
jgi:probable F420-dependent oxidoreductase